MSNNTSEVTYAFQIRFALEPKQFIDVEDKFFDIGAEDKNIELFLESGAGKAIKESDELVLLGRGFKTEKEARIFGGNLLTALRLYPVYNGLGIDLQEAKSKAGMSDWILSQSGQGGSETELINNIGGLVVYKDLPKTRYLTALPPFTTTTPPNNFFYKLREALILDKKINNKLKTALDIYNSHFFEKNRKAQFITLMTVIESLALQFSKEKDIVNYLDELINITKGSSLSKGNKDKVVSSLSGSKKESINTSCKNIIKKYAEDESYKIFDRLYGIRSSIVHSGAVKNEDEFDKDYYALRRLVESLLKSYGD